MGGAIEGEGMGFGVGAIYVGAPGKRVVEGGIKGDSIAWRTIGLSHDEAPTKSVAGSLNPATHHEYL